MKRYRIVQTIVEEAIIEAENEEEAIRIAVEEYVNFDIQSCTDRYAEELQDGE